MSAGSFNASSPSSDPIGAVSNNVSERSAKLFWLGLFLATLPLLLVYVVTLRRFHGTHYDYVPFALLLVGVLAFIRFDRRFTLPRDWFGWGLVAIGALTLLPAIYLNSSWLGTLAFILIGAAWLWTSREANGGRLIALALPLAMVLKLPVGLDQSLIQSLQRVATKVSGSLLFWLDIPHIVTGNVIGLANRDLFVAEACSGIQSVFTLLFIATVLIAIRRYHWWYVPIFWAAAVLCAVLGNSLRIVIVAIAEVWYQKDWSSGTPHELVGYATLLIAIFMLLSFEHFFTGMFHPIRSPESEENVLRNGLVRFWDRWLAYATSRSESPGKVAVKGVEKVKAKSSKRRSSGRTIGLGAAAKGSQGAKVVIDPKGDDEVVEGDLAGERSEIEEEFERELKGEVKVIENVAPVWEPEGRRLGWLGWGAVAVGTLLAVVSGIGLARNLSAYTEQPIVDYSSNRIFAPPAELMPATLGDLPVTGYIAARDDKERILGVPSDIWSIGTERFQGKLVLSQPYFGWHDLCICYQNLNWELLDRELVQSTTIPEMQEGASSGSPTYAFARFRRRDDEYGYLWFSAVTYRGETYPPPSNFATEGLARRLSEVQEKVADTNLMLVQLWVESADNLRPSDLEILRRGFEMARGRVVKSVRELAASQPKVETPQGSE
jgi:exosortase